MKTKTDKEILRILKHYVDNPKEGRYALQVADLYLYGDGFKQSDEKAFEFYKKASKLGCVESFYMTGAFYFMSVGTRTNYKKAFEWFKAGALANDYPCTIWYGMCLTDGTGCKKNPKLAAKYLAPGALGGDSVAQYCLGLCYLKKEMGTDYQKALFWIKEAAQQNHFQALYKLGTMYEKGIGVTKDRQIAYNYYLRSAEAGSSDAKEKLKLWHSNKRRKSLDTKRRKTIN